MMGLQSSLKNYLEGGTYPYYLSVWDPLPLSPAINRLSQHKRLSIIIEAEGEGIYNCPETIAGILTVPYMQGQENLSKGQSHFSQFFPVMI